MRLLSDSEQWTIANALRVAADQYATVAYTSDTAGQPRTAHAFRVQRDEARRLADAFEQANAVTINE